MSREKYIDKLVIALPSGRLMKSCITLLEKTGIDLKGGREINRKLSFYDRERNIKIIITKPKDNPTYIEFGAADIGIVGEDVLIEEKKDVYKLLDLKLDHFKLVLAAPKRKDRENIVKNNGHRLKIATKYPNIARDYFKKKGIYVEIIKLYGSVELAPLAGLADMIIDIVSTGRTLKENNLEIIDEIMPLGVQLIVNRISYKTKHDKIMQLLKEIQRFILPVESTK